MRTNNNAEGLPRWKLIDLDASCKLENGAKAAAKFSSAYLPPEMVKKRDDGELCVLSEQSDGVEYSELKEPSVALDCECACFVDDMRRAVREFTAE